MKKFLKVFIVVLLVIAVIAGTAFFFFKRLKEKNNSTGSIVAMLYSEEKIRFNADLSSVSNFINSDGHDKRLDIIITTNENLDEIVYVLSSYYIEIDTNINNEDIASALKKVNSSRYLLSRIIAEYNVKKESTYFNRHIGANDLFKQSCIYLVNYATLASLLNESLTNINKSADVKFNMFNVYSNVVINTFNETIQNENLMSFIKDENNINAINNVFNIDDSYIVTNVNQFSMSINRFNEYYNKCDKTAFAKNLSTNISSVASAEQDTNEKIATFYFKEIYGI